MGGLLSASLDDIEAKDLILGTIGAKAKYDAGGKLEVKKMVFAFNQGKAGDVFWDPSVGIASPDDTLVSGATAVTRWATLLLALFLPALSTLFRSTDQLRLMSTQHLVVSEPQRDLES